MKYFTSLSNLSLRATDFLNTFILPFISLLSFLCGLICIRVLMNKKLKGIIFQHMFFESIADVIYSFINFFFFIIRCGVYCPYGYNYYSKVYELYVYIFIGKSIELFTILIDLNLAILKYKSFLPQSQSSQQQTTIGKFNNVEFRLRIKFLLFLMLSLVIATPSILMPRSINFVGLLITNSTKQINQTTELYVVSQSEISYDVFFNYFSLLIAFGQGAGLLIVIMILNIIILVKLKRFLNQSSRQNNIGIILNIIDSTNN